MKNAKRIIAILMSIVFIFVLSQVYRGEVQESSEEVQQNSEQVQASNHIADTSGTALVETVDATISTYSTPVNLNNKIDSSNLTLEKRATVNGSTEWVMIDPQLISTIFETTVYRVTIDFELDGMQTVSAGDYFDIQFPVAIDTSGFPILKDVNGDGNQQVVANFIRNSSDMTRGSVIFTDAFDEETSITGRIMININYSASNRGNIAWNFDVGQQQTTYNGIDGTNTDYPQVGAMISKTGWSSKSYLPGLTDLNMWRIFLNYESISGNMDSSLNDKVVLTDTWQGNQTIAPFWKTTNTPEPNNGTYGFSDNIPTDKTYFTIYKIPFQGMQQLRASFGLGNGKVNNALKQEIINQANGTASSGHPMVVEKTVDVIESIVYDSNTHDQFTMTFKEGTFSQGDSYYIIYMTQTTDNWVSVDYKNSAQISLPGGNAVLSTVLGNGSGVAKGNGGNLVITKVDKENASVKLPNAKFKLTKANGNVIELTTDANGQIMVKLDGTFLLDGGICKLEEVDAPTGYNSLDAPIMFKIADDYGSIQELSNSPKDLVKIDSNSITGLIISNSQKPKDIGLTLKKTDATNADVLLGSTFALTKPDGSKELIDLGSVGTSPQILFSNPVGDYLLEEIKVPDNYDLSKKAYGAFTISEDNTQLLGYKVEFHTTNSFNMTLSRNIAGNIEIIAVNNKLTPIESAPTQSPSSNNSTPTQPPSSNNSTPTQPPSSNNSTSTQSPSSNSSTTKQSPTSNNSTPAQTTTTSVPSPSDSLTTTSVPSPSDSLTTSPIPSSSNSLTPTPAPKKSNGATPAPIVNDDSIPKPSSTGTSHLRIEKNQDNQYVVYDEDGKPLGYLTAYPEYGMDDQTILETLIPFDLVKENPKTSDTDTIESKLIYLIMGVGLYFMLNTYQKRIRNSTKG